jgi:N-acetylglucosaminyldiphosphoundecaprenol N-acetyl-beta-D-mannosaminyltransferase
LNAGGPDPVAPARVDVLGVPVARLRFGDLLAHLDRALAAPRGGMPAYYSYVNAHCARLAARDPAYRDALGRADVVYADGIGVVWASRALGGACPERINVGPAELGDILDRAADRRAPVFVLGGAPGIAEEVARRQRARRPDLAIAGTHHGYFEDGEAVVGAINASGADLVLVGLGPPEQELWVARYLDDLRVRACWCVGGLLDQVAGAVPHAPDWVRRNHVQWLYRLAVEPRRLWRRYLLGNPDFIALVARQRLGRWRGS